MIEVSFGHCCFCGAGSARKPDSCSLRVQTTNGEWQVSHYHEILFPGLVKRGYPATDPANGTGRAHLRAGNCPYSSGTVLVDRL